MKIKLPTKTYLMLIEKLQRLVYKLDNSGDTNIHKNGELRFIKEVSSQFKDSLTFFDIGANQGEYTELMLNHAKADKLNFHLFEPQNSCLTNLRDKFSTHENIKINGFGLSGTNSTETIYKNTESSGLASLYQRDLKHYSIDMQMTEQVSLRKGLDYVNENHIERVNFMKIDVEGHEIQVFLGFGEFLSTKNIDIIQFEYGGANLDSKTSLLDLFNLLQKNGFVLCKIMRQSLQRVDRYDPRFENFVYQNWVAVNPELLKN